MANRYRSGLERRIAGELTSASCDFEYETVKLPWYSQHKYTPDFLILSNGIHIETKGFFKPCDRSKHLKVREANPSIDIRFCFQNAYNKLNKNSKTTYGDWCDKHDFLWCHKVVPKHWLEE